MNIGFRGDLGYLLGRKVAAYKKWKFGWLQEVILCHLIFTILSFNMSQEEFSY